MFPEHPFAVLLIPYVRLFWKIGYNGQYRCQIWITNIATNLLFQSHLGDHGSGLLIGLGPFTRTGSIGCVVLASRTIRDSKERTQPTRGVYRLRLAIEISIGGNVTLRIAQSTNRQHGRSQC
jgi:hypothetical protein